MSGTVTIEADHVPPRVRIDTTATTVTRLDAGAAVAVPVRGSVVGGVIYDYECPQETSVTYLDGLGLSQVVEMPDVGVWMIPPSDPDLGAPLLVDQDGFPGWVRPAGIASAHIPGRANAIAIDFGRGAREGSMKVWSLYADDFARLTVCLDAVGPKFLSFNQASWPAFGSVSWVQVGDVNEVPFASLEAGDVQTWSVSFTLTPVDRPAFVESMSGGAIADLVGTISSLVGAIGDLSA